MTTRSEEMAADIFEVQWTREQLWKGCMLASIAHAIMVSRFLEISNEHSWDGINYSVQDSAGTRGTVTFHTEYCVAAFRNEKSRRISSGEINADRYFKGAPHKIIELAEAEALQYLLDKINGKIVPVITTAFWEKENKIFTRDSYDEMIENGGFILERQVMDTDSAINVWVDYYEMDERQVVLLRSIYERKISNPTNVISLSKDEIGMIGTDDLEGLAESKSSFEEMGILLEV
jgi:hypothetical protein